MTAEAEHILYEFVHDLQERCTNERHRRKNPGGQQAGVPRMAGLSLSFIMELERDCRNILEHVENLNKRQK